MRKEKPHASRGAWGYLFGVLAFLATGLAGCVDLGTPQWSPDGRRIIYTRAGPGDPEVRLVDLDRGKPAKLIAADAYRPRWSPDGGRIYFLDSDDTLRACRPDGSDVREMAAGVLWYEPSPDGEKVYYVRERDAAVVELVLATGRAGRVTPDGVKCAGSALGPEGELLAYAVAEERRGRAGYEIRLVDLEEGNRLGGQAVPGERVLGDFIPAAGRRDESGGLLMLFRRRTAELVAFQHHGAERIHIVPLAGGRSRAIKIEKLGWAVMSSISPEGAYLYLTDATDESATSRLVDLETGEPEVLVKDSSVLVGGLGWAPGGGAVAEHSPAGLLVREVHDAWERYYPAGADEYATAARIRMREGRSREALDILEEALELREAGLDRQRLGLVAAEAHLLLGERKEAADRLLEAWLLHPVSGASESEAVRLFGALRVDDRLVDAIHRALRKEPGGRAKMLKEAMSFAGEARFLAGLQFRLGEAEFAAKNYTEAGKRFRVASEAEDFPAADYAAALAAGAHFVSGRNDRYAEELLLKAIDGFPTSPLQDDFHATLSFVRREKGAVIRRTEEVSHESGATAWVTVRSTRSMRRSPLGPKEARGGRRSFALDVKERSTLSVAGPDAAAKEILFQAEGGPGWKLGLLRFSPSGDRLAFLAGATVTSLTAGGTLDASGGWTELYVIDLDGKIILGDRKALEGEPKAATREIRTYRWDPRGATITVQERPLTPGRGKSGYRERRVGVPRPAPRARP